MKNLRNYLKSNLDINPSEIVDDFYKKYKLVPISRKEFKNNANTRHGIPIKV